jgi:hypothetical protein
VELNVKTERIKQIPREIPLYKKAEWDKLARHIRAAGEVISEKASSASVNELWNILFEAIKTGIKQFIPHKTSKLKDSLPWMNTNIKKMIKRRDRLHRKKKTSRNFNRSSLQHQSIDEKIRVLNKTIQRDMRRAYWAYIKSLITPDEASTEYSGMKKFWTFIKQRKKDANRVAPLEANGLSTSTAKGKANALNEQSSSN